MRVRWAQCRANVALRYACRKFATTPKPGGKGSTPYDRHGRYRCSQAEQIPNVAHLLSVSRPPEIPKNDAALLFRDAYGQLAGCYG